MVTRFYLHAATSGVSGTLPSTEQSALTAAANVDAQTVNRSMNTTVGTSSTFLTTGATVGTRDLYFSKFVSPPIFQTSVAANTWTYSFCAIETDANDNFPVNGTNQPVYVNCYVWRPSTGAKIGTILDGNTASTVDEGAGSTYVNHVVTFTGSSVAGVQNGDVIIFEVWFRVTSTGVAAQYFMFDGTTVLTENQSGISDAASYIETPENFNLSGATFSRTLATETVTLTESVGRIANKKRASASAETVAITSSVVALKNYVGPVNYTRNISQSVSISSAVAIVASLVSTKKYTGSPTYWQPLRPRIKIYALTDSSYSSPLYTYDAFLDTGNTAKPISLSFESTTGNAGTFTLEIEDSTNTLNPDTFSRGNRVLIECSKDGSLYRIAFKGVIRSIDQKVYGQTGKNIILKGYSYLIRLTERVVDFQAQSSLDAGGNYIRTDSTMFTNTLLNTILTNDSTYLYTQDDTALYNFFRVNNIASSSITQWIPRIDAQLATLNDAVGSIVEFSNSLLGVNMSNDQLVLYNQDNVTTDSQIFLVTNKVDKDSDLADTTMYPIEPYSYNFGYDNPDNASRLIASIGTARCPEIPETSTTTHPDSWLEDIGATPYYYASPQPIAIQEVLTVTAAPLKNITVGLTSKGNVSFMNHVNVTFHVSWGTAPPTTPTFPMYYHADPATPNFPSSGTPNFWVGFLPTQTGLPTLAAGSTVGFLIWNPGSMTSTNAIGWLYDPGDYGSGHIWDGTGLNSTLSAFRYDMNLQPAPVTTTIPGVPACGGPPNTADADPNFLVAADMNQINRIGMIEKVITSLPDHIKNSQTMNEYFFAKIYSSSKPKFTFDFPSVTMPNIMPVAGDIVCHVDTLAKIGVAGNPIQTGIISQINYDFRQDDEGVLGLTKLALQTTGIKRGSY